jgi:hypothetical protein
MGLRRERSFRPGKSLQKIFFVPKNFATQKFFTGKIPGKIFFKPKKSGFEIFQVQKNPVLKFFKRKNFPVKFSSAKKVREERDP